MSPDPSPDRPKASVAVREELLKALCAAPGAVVVGRRASETGDVLVVRMTAPGAVPSHLRLQSFQGFAVTYEVVPAAKAGHW